MRPSQGISSWQGVRMRRPTTLAVLAVAGAAVMACHTISEDLPTRPTQVQGGPVPVVVRSQGAAHLRLDAQQPEVVA